MKNTPLILCLLVLGFAACQRTTPNDQLAPTDANDTGLLKQIRTVLLPDSFYQTYETYFYDNNRHLRDRTVGMNNVFTHTTYTRDAQGRLVKWKYKTSKPDSTEIGVVYESASSTKVKYLSDSSAVFTYNGSGQIIRTDSYQPIPAPGSGYKLAAYHLYSYDASNNLVKREEFTDPDQNGTFTLNITYFMEYDDKPNPRYPIDDAMIELSFLDMSPNNLVKMRYDIAAAGPTDGENIINFQYGTLNKPLMNQFQSSDGRKTVTYYSYY